MLLGALAQVGQHVPVVVLEPALALVGIGQILLCRLQVGAERVDVVQPGGGADGLRVALDELQGVLVVVELFHQLEHRRDIGRMGGRAHDAFEFGVELGGVHSDDRGLGLVADQDHEQRDERDRDQGEQGNEDDARDEHLVGGVHRSLSEVRSRTSLFG